MPIGWSYERNYPRLWEATQQPPSPALERARVLASSSLRKLSVTVDARSLGSRTGGTQVYVLELIRALAGTGEVAIRALVGPDREVIDELGDLASADTSIITYEQALGDVGQTDVVHRPQQVFTIDDLRLLEPLGGRLVITHLDLIAYHNPTYFPDLAHWQRHVRSTRIALAAADHVIFCSAHARRDAEREDLVEDDRTSVVALGVDTPQRDAGGMARPRGLESREEPFLLCLGSDYAHKNRPFALELVAELRRAHGWPGILVLAGTHVDYGSSAAAEQSVRERLPELEGAVVDLGGASDAERRWLMAQARAVLYPTVLEGFGLVPFEAAAAGVPCLFASQSSLAEMLPPELATLDGWSAERAGARAIALLSDDAARASHVAAVRRAAERFRWERCAGLTVAAYRASLRLPACSSAHRAWEAAAREQEIVRLDQAVFDLEAVFADAQARIQAIRDSLGADALALVGPDGLLSSADQRALLALAARPALARPLLGAARAGYRLAHRTRAAE